MNQFEILARLYDLLGKCEISELEMAARTDGLSPSIRRCLKTLRDAKCVGENSHSRLSPSDKSEKKDVAASRKKSAEVETRRTNGYEKRVAELMFHKDLFKTNKELAKYLNDLGFDVKFDEKDGRRRMHSKLLRSLSAVNALSKHYAELSAQVHAASGTLPRLTLAEPFDKVDQEQLSRFRKSQKAVFANGALLIAATKPKRLGKLGANERSWFDWLIGNRDSRRLRGGPFGLV